MGDIPDDQVFIPYRPADGAFTVDVPEGWARTDGPDSVSFTDKLNTVGIRELTDRPQPTPETVTSGELADAVAAASHGKEGTAEKVTLPAGEAVHATYAADSAPDPVTGRTVQDDVELYVYWKGGTEVLLTLSGPHGADNVDPWAKVSSSFAWS
ncbi:MAG: lipoprotein [Blastococcus sp.]|nr:lipoprotein [Blastococcus sp.]